MDMPLDQRRNVRIALVKPGYTAASAGSFGRQTERGNSPRLAR